MASWFLELVSFVQIQTLYGERFLSMYPIRVTHGIYVMREWIFDADTGASMYLQESRPVVYKESCRTITWPLLDLPMVLCWDPRGITVRFGIVSQRLYVGLVDLSHIELFTRYMRGITFTPNGTKCHIIDMQWDGDMMVTVLIIAYDMLITLRISYVYDDI